MKFIDLSYKISEKTQMYPGLFKPKIYQECNLKNDGVNIKRLNFITHTGTHIDAPRHFYPKGMTIDKIPLNKFIGEAIFLDLSNTKLGSIIDITDIKKYESLISIGDILIVNTGIYKKYGKEDYNKRYSTINPKVAKWLVGKKISTYATDATSVDIDGENIIHKILLGSDIPIIENLSNLDIITKERFKFVALPLKINNGDGAPCRAVAIEEF